MFPSAPSFRTDETYGLWWLVNRSSGQDVCAINASAWLRSVRSALGLATTAVWDATLAAALVNAAGVMDREQPGQGWDAIVRVLQADASARLPSGTGFQFATWFTFYRPNRLRFDALGTPANIVLPVWGQVVAPPVSRRLDPMEGDRLACYRPDTETPPDALTTADRRGAESASSIGVRVRPGEATDQGDEEIDTGPSAIPPAAVFAGIALLLIVGGIFVSTTNMKSTPKRRVARANPHAWMGPLA